MSIAYALLDDVGDYLLDNNDEIIYDYLYFIITSNYRLTTRMVEIAALFLTMEVINVMQMSVSEIEFNTNIIESEIMHIQLSSESTTLSMVEI